MNTLTQCSNYFKKTCGFYFFVPRSGWGIGCLALLALPGLRYSGSAPLCGLSILRSGYHFCLWQKMKPAKASFHAAAKRSFIHCSVAAMCFIRRQPCFIFYKPCQTWHGVAKRRRLKHCFRLHFITPRQAADAPQYGAAAAVKHKRLKPLV